MIGTVIVVAHVVRLAIAMKSRMSSPVKVRLGGNPKNQRRSLHSGCHC